MKVKQSVAAEEAKLNMSRDAAAATATAGDTNTDSVAAAKGDGNISQASRNEATGFVFEEVHGCTICVCFMR